MSWHEHIFYVFALILSALFSSVFTYQSASYIVNCIMVLFLFIITNSVYCHVTFPKTNINYSSTKSGKFGSQ